MNTFVPLVVSAPLRLAFALGLLAGCDQNTAPDDETQSARAPEIARILPADEALSNAQVSKLHPATMNDAEIRKAVGTGPRCEFRYTSSGKPVLAVSAQPNGPVGGIVKLNGHLVPLEAAPTEEEARPDGSLLLAANPIRVQVTPDRGEQAGDRNGMRRRVANMAFEVGESLRAGYRGYLDCSPEQYQALGQEGSGSGQHGQGGAQRHRASGGQPARREGGDSQ